MLMKRPYTLIERKRVATREGQHNWQSRRELKDNVMVAIPSYFQRKLYRKLIEMMTVTISLSMFWLGNKSVCIYLGLRGKWLNNMSHTHTLLYLYGVNIIKIRHPKRWEYTTNSIIVAPTQCGSTFMICSPDGMLSSSPVANTPCTRSLCLIGRPLKRRLWSPKRTQLERWFHHISLQCAYDAVRWAGRVFVSNAFF